MLKEGPGSRLVVDTKECEGCSSEGEKRCPIVRLKKALEEAGDEFNIRPYAAHAGLDEIGCGIYLYPKFDRQGNFLKYECTDHRGRFVLVRTEPNEVSQQQV